MKTYGIIYFNGTDEFPLARNFLNSLIHKMQIFEDIKIVQIKNSKYDYTILLSNGDRWQCRYGIEASRGNRCNIMYYSNTIPKEIVKTVLIPTCTLGIGLVKSINLKENIYNDDETF